MALALDALIVVLLGFLGWVLVDAAVGEWKEEDGWADEATPENRGSAS